jgi:hypothetical protein
MKFFRPLKKTAPGVPVNVLAFTGFPAFSAPVVRPVNAVFVELNGEAN